MTTKQRQSIEKYVSTVSKSLSIAYPVSFTSLERICVNLGGSIEHENLEPYIDGKVVSHNSETPKKFTITLNKTQTSSNRDLFTLAHEMGHLFLHTKYFNKNEVEEEEEYIDSYTRGGDYTEKERQADYFAGALLMPEHLYTKQVDKYTSDEEYGIEGIAKFFQVSVSSATIRGKWLGIFKW